MPVARTPPILHRRITALVGPYGSGKTELSLALAAAHAQTSARPVALADLDVLKPYFRSREAAARAQRMGVQVLAPAGAWGSADLPILPADLRGALQDPSRDFVIDVGGDETGARVLGSLSDILAAADCELLLVLNRHRPFTTTAEQAVQLARGIEAAARLRFAGIVSNTHLMEHTTDKDVRAGLAMAQEAAALVGVAVRFVGVPFHLAGAFAQELGWPTVVPLERHMLPAFMGGAVLHGNLVYKEAA